MKVIVIGANGFLGRAIASKCLKLGWETWGSYNQSDNNMPKWCKKIHISKVQELKDDFDILFVAIGNFTLSHRELINTNVLATNHLSMIFKSAKLVFISSIAVYGVQNGTINEVSGFNNPTAYGLSKIAGEFVASSHKNYSIIRLSNLYGIGMISLSFIPKIINDAVNKRVITLKNTKRVHDYLSVEDAANLCIKVGLCGSNEIYLGATGKSVSNLDIAKNIQKLIFGCKLEIQESINSQSYFFNPEMTMKKLEWKPERSIQRDLKLLVKFYEDSYI